MRLSLVSWFGALVVSLVLSAGCSSFRGDARRARASAPPAGSVEGHWEGRWYRLDKPEHGGRMEMVLTRTGDQVYRASARSQWWRVFRSAYDSTLILTPVGPGQHLLQGSQDLWLFGGYTVTGRVDQARLDAVFVAGGHRGAMELHRAGAAPATP